MSNDNSLKNNSSNGNSSYGNVSTVSDKTNSEQNDIIKNTSNTKSSEVNQSELIKKAQSNGINQTKLSKKEIGRSSQTSQTVNKTAKRVQDKAASISVAGRVAVRKSNFDSLNTKDAKVWAVSALKILLPAVACVVVIGVIISFVVSKRDSDVEGMALDGIAETQGNVVLSQEPLEENAYPAVNELISELYQALADGDMDKIAVLYDNTDDEKLITYEKKSEFIESYENVTCYTKNGIEENSYFVYVTYDVKFKDIETKAPGLQALYVYTNDEGSLVIADKDEMDDSVEAVFKLVTVQYDVVDLYQKVEVNYTNVLATDDKLKVFIEELPEQVRSSVGVALAQLKAQEAEQMASETSSGDNNDAVEENQTPESESQQEEVLQNQAVNQIVRATDTVNVRSSDSEEADRIGRVTSGTELTRVEERINGWSKIIYEGKEAFIKSNYLEVVSTEATGDVIRQVKATTNVNVRSEAKQDSSKLGLAETDNTYDLLEDLGEWYKINFNGVNGYVKSEFFE